MPKLGLGELMKEPGWPMGEGRTEGRTEGQMDGRTEERTDGRTNGRTDGRTGVERAAVTAHRVAAAARELVDRVSSFV